MPANSKYLTTSGWTRFSKITAGFFGGFCVSISLHLVLTVWFDRPTVMITSAFTGFILWAVLLMSAFLIRKAWKVWAVYLGLTLLFSAVVYINQMNPAL